MPQVYRFVAVRLHIFYSCRARVWPPSIVLQVAEGTIHEACGELPTGDKEGVNCHQLAPEVGRGSLGDVHWHRHAGDACGEWEIEGRKWLAGGCWRERRWLSAMIPVSCVKSFLYILPESSSVFFSYKNVLIITKASIRSNPPTFFSDVADFPILYAFHYFHFFLQIWKPISVLNTNMRMFFFRKNRWDLKCLQHSCLKNVSWTKEPQILHPFQ